MSSIGKHTHKYYRIKLGKNKRIEFRCGFHGCVHHVPPELALGRFSICWVCGSEFILDKLALQLAKPHCRYCTKSNNIKILMEVLEGEKR